MKTKARLAYHAFLETYLRDFRIPGLFDNRDSRRHGLSVAALRPLIRKQTPVIVEIGANDGSETLAFLHLFPEAVVHCFEPDPRAAAAFRTNVKNPRCTLHECAVSDASGTAAFHLSGGSNPRHKHLGSWTQSSSLKEPKEHLQQYPWCTFGENVTVQTVTLDEWAGTHIRGNIDLLWADVQGGERELIEGGRKTLEERTRYFYTECEAKELYAGQPTLADMLKLLPTFVVERRFAANVLLRNAALVP